jgi:hypothetical protein
MYLKKRAAPAGAAFLLSVHAFFTVLRYTFGMKRYVALVLVGAGLLVSAAVPLTAAAYSYHSGYSGYSSYNSYSNYNNYNSYGNMGYGNGYYQQSYYQPYYQQSYNNYMPYSGGYNVSGYNIYYSYPNVYTRGW